MLPNKILKFSGIALLAVAIGGCTVSQDYPYGYNEYYPRNTRVAVGVQIGYPETYYPTRYRNHLPPGQAKKIYGAQSARDFAPGQRKKYGYSDEGD